MYGNNNKRINKNETHCKYRNENAQQIERDRKKQQQKCNEKKTDNITHTGI